MVANEGGIQYQNDASETTLCFLSGKSVYFCAYVHDDHLLVVITCSQQGVISILTLCSSAGRPSD